MGSRGAKDVTILYMGTLPYEKATVPRMMLSV